MVIVKLAHGLGNQLFMYAAARCAAYKLNTELKIDLTRTEIEKQSEHAYYRLGDFNIQENFATPYDIKHLTAKDVYMDALYQKDIFFIEIDDIIRKEFTLKDPLNNKASYWRDKINSVNCSVALHIRRGDYDKDLRFRVLFGTLPLEYYYDAINSLKNIVRNFTVFVFSDDINWAKQNLKLDVPMEFIEGVGRDSEEMYLMSLCKHNIIANSTFSWWGAWLNNNPDKKVFAPYPWFRNATISGDLGGIIPDHWIKIASNFDKNFNYNTQPLLSIIIYVENISLMFQHTIDSILAQTLKEYEVIVIDASTNNIGEFYRQLANTANVSFLKVSSEVDKFKARNIGIVCARGDYILFLTSNSFIIPKTTHLLFQILFSSFSQFEKASNEHPDYEKYKPISPSIILSTASISEDINGTIVINEIAGKKFALKNDSFFQNLNDSYTFQFNSQLKAILLATEQINNFIGTKFFKRSFLIDNKIRFEENISDDAELLFLINAFMHTNNINFVPYAFYGHLN